MLSFSNPKHIIPTVILLFVAGFVAVQMYFSLTPPRHADHDHAMASLDAGGFLRIEASGGGNLNLVADPPPKTGAFVG